MPVVICRVVAGRATPGSTAWPYRGDVGTSFTRYRRAGFWTRDAALETVLALLVLELEPLAKDNPGLEPVLDDWTLQSVAGFGGCVSAGLDEHLTSQPGLGETVTAALRRIRDRLPLEGSIEVSSPGLAERADRVCEGSGWSAPGALATWAVNVADALADLVAGRLPETPDDFWFVDGDGRRTRPKQRS
jgi:hypothetical protein